MAYDLCDIRKTNLSGLNLLSGLKYGEPTTLLSYFLSVGFGVEANTIYFRDKNVSLSFLISLKEFMCMCVQVYTCVHLFVCMCMCV